MTARLSRVLLINQGITSEEVYFLFRCDYKQDAIASLVVFLSNVEPIKDICQRHFYILIDETVSDGYSFNITIRFKKK